MFDFAHTIPARGSVHTFPVQLAPDGKPCVLGPAVRALGPGKTTIVFTFDGTSPAVYPMDENTALCSVRPGDFLGVYTRTPNGLTLQSFRIESIHLDNLTAILADTLLISNTN